MKISSPLFPVSSLLQKVFFFAIHLLLAMEFLLATYSSSSYAVLNRHAVGELAQSPSHASWTSTIFFVGRGLGMFISPWLSQSLGKVRSLYSAIVILILSNLVMAIGEDFYLFLLIRFFLGLAVGAVMMLCQYVLMDFYPINKWPFVTSLFGFLLMTTFGFGPSFGALIQESHWNWREYFTLNVLLHSLGLAFLWALLGKKEEEKRKIPFDGVGFLLITLCFISFQTLASRGQDEDWYNSLFINVLFFIGVASLIYFFVWELGEKKPFFDVRLLLMSNFLIANLIGPLSFGALYGAFSILIGALQEIGYSSFLSSLPLIPMLVCLPILYPLSVYLSNRSDPRPIASFCFALLALFCYMTSTYDFFNRRSYFVQSVLVSQLFLGGMVGILPPLNRMVIEGLSPRHQQIAINWSILLRTFSFTVGAGLLGTLLEHRTAFQQSRLVETRSLFDPSVMEFLQRLRELGLDSLQALKEYAYLVSQRSYILAVDDTFRFCAILYFFVSFFVWASKIKKLKKE
ncbi:MFS transporter [Methylacidiphilum caldifontis]|uniref:MFS transporter n=1 Tax=Methylacidiphilum caldifontis TaxID=2795386 RepID=UPI001A8D3684|nr:MFS transporter [Methylacidiphilum caldifontis]QSR89101.1 MFS transporter [Methylacidiphilum caldifontis]